VLALLQRKISPAFVPDGSIRDLRITDRLYASAATRNLVLSALQEWYLLPRIHGVITSAIDCSDDHGYFMD